MKLRVEFDNIGDQDSATAFLQYIEKCADVFCEYRGVTVRDITNETMVFVNSGPPIETGQPVYISEPPHPLIVECTELPTETAPGVFPVTWSILPDFDPPPKINFREFT